MGSRDFVLHFLRAYPLRTSLMIGMLLFSGLAEGLGFFTLLPMLEMAAGSDGAAPSEVTVALSSALDRIGLGATLGTLLVIICLAMILKAAFRWLAMRQVGFTVARVATDLRLRLIRALMQARWSHFIGQPIGHYATAIATQAHRASGAYREACAAMAGIIRLFVYLAVALLVSWRIAVASLVIGAFGVFVLKGFVRMARAAGQDQTYWMDSLIRRLTEVLPGIKPVKAMARERFLLRLLERETEEYNDAQREQVLASGAVSSLQEPILIITLAIGLYLAMTLGDQSLAPVLVLAVLFYRLVGTVNQLQSEYQSMTVGESAFEVLHGHIEAAEAGRETVLGEVPAPPLDQDIRFENVSFSHGAVPVLVGASFVVPARSLTVFVGPSGSGKTTLLDLMVGLYPPESGRVLVDGIDLREVATGGWRGGIGYVPQELVLFHSSILENVTLGNSEIRRDQVRGALEAAGAWDFVSSHKDGMDRIVGEGGLKLSGGQRQRIAIARALVGSPRLLVLDEAMTGLDPETEAEVCRTLQQLSRTVTIVSVSHQPGLRQVADHVFAVEGGAVSPLWHEGPIEGRSDRLNGSDRRNGSRASWLPDRRRAERRAG